MTFRAGQTFFRANQRLCRTLCDSCLVLSDLGLSKAQEQGEGVEYSGVKKTGMIREGFLGSFRRFLGVGKFDRIFQLGNFFFGQIQINLKIRGSAGVSQPRSSENKVKPNLFQLFSVFCGSFKIQYFREILKARKFGWDFFGGVNVCWRPQGFFWVLIFTPMRSSLSLEIRSISPLGSQRQPYRFKTTVRNTKKR